MILGCALYRNGRRVPDGLASVAEAAAARSGSDFVWVDLDEPDEREMEELAARFSLPELAVEDAHQAHQRPKLEQYGSLFFIVLRTAAWDSEASELSLGEMHLFVGRDHVIVVRHGTGLDFEALHERAESRPELLAHGPAAVAYQVADQVVDGYGPVVDKLSGEIEDVETAVFSESVRDTTKKIYRLKREVIELHRATSPLRISLEAIQDQGPQPIPDGLRDYFRDVHDHLQHMDDQVEGFRELLTGILEANVALVSVRQNDIVQKISGWAAIIAVPTLITGIYGMNFKDMPELGSPLGYPMALAAMAVIAGGLYALLKRIGWI